MSSEDLPAREQRRDDALKAINILLADLVADESHMAARTQLLEIIAAATGYQYALLAENEPDGKHMCVTAI